MNDIISVAVPLLATTALAVGVIAVTKPEPVMQMITGKNALERACSEPQNAKIVSQIGMSMNSVSFESITRIIKAPRPTRVFRDHPPPLA